MRPSRPAPLLLLALGGAVVGYLVLRASWATLPPVPRLSTAVVAVLAAVVGGTAVAVRGRRAGRPGTRPIEPIAVARAAALGRAGSAAGALLAGGYLGALGYTVGRLSTPAGSTDAVTTGLGVAAALALTGAGLALERACRADGGAPPAGRPGAPPPPPARR